MSKMQCVLAVAPDAPFELAELPIPEPGPGEVLVRMKASGICPTDTSIARGRWAMRRPRYPYVPGHEGAGVVHRTGEAVTAWREGDPVGVFWLNSACGDCRYCAGARENLCTRQKSTGYTVNGTHAEYCVVDQRFLVPLPSQDFAALTPIMCAGVTSYKAIKELRGAPGDWVVVVGIGGTGFLAVQFARAAGYRVIAVDPSEEKLAKARQLGAELVARADKSPVNRIVVETGGGADGIVVATGDPGAFEQATRMLRRGGTCVVVGVSESPLPLAAFPLVIHEHTVLGTLSGSRSDLAEALRLAGEGKVRTEATSVTLQGVNDAVAALDAGTAPIRSVITF